MVILRKGQMILKHSGMLKWTRPFQHRQQTFLRNKGPYKSAVIAAPHRQLQIAAIDDGEGFFLGTF